MADYYPLIARAVAGLEKSTGEGRRTLYERARAALVAQLRSAVPALSESDITRERLALEEAVRKVEGEAARRTRVETPPSGPAAARAQAAGGAREDMPRAVAPQGAPAATAATARAPATARAGLGERPSLTDEGLKGFRDGVAETGELDGSPAQHGRGARDPYAAPPPASHEYDRLAAEPEPSAYAQPPREYVSPPRTAEPALGIGETRQPPPRPRRQAADEESIRPPRSYVGTIKVAVIVLLIAALGGLLFWQRDNVVALADLFSGQPAQVTREATPSRPKINDRIGPGGAEQPGQLATPGGQPGAAVAQRALLFEQGSGEQQGERLEGTAVWRTETISAGPGRAPEIAVRADVQIPSRRLTMTMTLRRNTDQTLPASHTIEMMFNMPPDVTAGGIANVPGILMRQDEQVRGAPIAGLAVKVTTGYFLIGLSAVDSDVQRNLQLLRERLWFDISIVYGNGRRAILALEKGNPGERVFQDAFAAWMR